MLEENAAVDRCVTGCGGMNAVHAVPVKRAATVKAWAIVTISFIVNDHSKSQRGVEEKAG